MADALIYRAYVDGSVFNGGQFAGAGWIVLNEQSGKCLTRGSRRIGECARGTTTLTEIYAAAAALDAVPTGSRIFLHSDDQDLCRVLQRNQLAQRIERNKGKPALHRAYSTLFNAVARHHEVAAIKTHISESKHFHDAHDLARIGAYQEPQCAVPPADSVRSTPGTSARTTDAAHGFRDRPGVRSIPAAP